MGHSPRAEGVKFLNQLVEMDVFAFPPLTGCPSLATVYPLPLADPQEPMKIRPALAAPLVALLLAVPAAADPVGAIEAPAAAEGEQAGVEVSTVPEPRSVIFVGLGALVVLSFALRRK